MKEYNSTEKVNSREEAMEMVKNMENMFGETEVVEEGNIIYQIAQPDGFTVKYIIK